jgi:hypothetical protein
MEKYVVLKHLFPDGYEATKNPRVIATIKGRIDYTDARLSDYGKMQYKFKGGFRFIRADTGESIDAEACFLPSRLEKLLVGWSQVAEETRAAVRFSLEVGVVSYEAREGSEGGYKFLVLRHKHEIVPRGGAAPEAAQEEAPASLPPMSQADPKRTSRPSAAGGVVPASLLAPKRTPRPSAKAVQRSVAAQAPANPPAMEEAPEWANDDIPF